MASVVVAIADSARLPLEKALVSRLARTLGGATRVLAEAEAVEITTGLAADRALALARPLVAGLPLDLAALPATHRVKRLLVSDMDSTMITVECIDEVADFAGLKAEVAEVTRRAMDGELDFVASLRARVALLAGLPEGVLAEVWRERVRMMPGARTLIATMKAKGALTALVSGGFGYFTSRAREALGFDVDEANRLEVRNGHLTGRLVAPVRDQRAKLGTLERLLAAQGLDRVQSLAVGDGANDLPMLAAAGLGVGFRAHPHVQTQVAVNIRHGDLTALLYLQGIAKRDFTPG